MSVESTIKYNEAVYFAVILARNRFSNLLYRLAQKIEILWNILEEISSPS